MRHDFPMRHEAMRIAGRKVDSKDRILVEYPYTGEMIGSVPAGTAEHAREAFEIAASYQPTLTRYERQKILLNVAKIISDRKAELAPIITAELGISIADSLYECGRAYDVYTLAGQMCIHDDGEIFSCDLTPHGKARKIFTTREPLRAISAITPFNHPLNMVSHKIAPAIATNNCVVLKPTELTPLTAIWLADALYEAGLPPQMLSVVTGWPGDIGDEMITNPNFDLITFTGGVPVGKMIAAKAVYKRQVLELGGNDPLIICNDLSDADLAKAADLAVAGATKNSGQRCTAVKRILCAGKCGRPVRAAGAGARQEAALWRSDGPGHRSGHGRYRPRRRTVRKARLHGRGAGGEGSLRSGSQGRGVAAHRGRSCAA